uniref:Uncharacterized protein n=1 Tax=Megaselia scalaris TaxID=36166 RepID=T1GMB1_MEGSC
MGGEVKVSTVDVEGDNTATLPVSRSHTTGSTDSAEKNNAANKEMELKNVMPQPLQRYTWKIFFLNRSSPFKQGEKYKPTMHWERELYPQIIEKE